MPIDPEDTEWGIAMAEKLEAMSDNPTTTTRLSRAALERNAGTVQRLKDAGMEYDITGYDYLVSGLATDARAYMTVLEKLRNIDPNNWSVIEDLIEWVAGEVNEVLP